MLHTQVLVTEGRNRCTTPTKASSGRRHRRAGGGPPSPPSGPHSVPDPWIGPWGGEDPGPGSLKTKKKVLILEKMNRIFPLIYRIINRIISITF